MNIGNWVRRTGDDDSKWHLVESTVAKAAFTKCGRRMDRDVEGQILEISEVEPLSRMIGQPQLCELCS